MADDTDFLEMYRRLGLEPGCTLTDFKQAYRRYVAQWHPDRRGETRADAFAARRLQRLTAQYGAAMDFHRRHARLPGAPVTPNLAPDVVIPPPASPDSVAESIVNDPPESPRRADRYGRVTAFVAVVAVLAWCLMRPAAAPDRDDAHASPVTPHATRSAPAPMLRLGMTADDVESIEGEPNRREDDRWEYGPSWIAFDDGIVSDWYSSPLRDLRAASTRPRR